MTHTVFVMSHMKDCAGKLKRRKEELGWGVAIGKRLYQAYNSLGVEHAK